MHSFTVIWVHTLTCSLCPSFSCSEIVGIRFRSYCSKAATCSAMNSSCERLSPSSCSPLRYPNYSKRIKFHIQCTHTYKFLVLIKIDTFNLTLIDDSYICSTSLCLGGNICGCFCFPRHFMKLKRHWCAKSRRSSNEFFPLCFENGRRTYNS